MTRRHQPPTPRHRLPGWRARRLSLAALTTAALGATLLVPSSNASWVDTEWVNGTLRTGECTPLTEGFATRGEGRLLSGSLLEIDLDTLVAAEGVTVTNGGSDSRVVPGPAQTDNEDAYFNPLSVEALSALNVDLTGTLQLPLDNDTGVVGQYAQAKSNGVSIGASGAITNTGGIATTPANGYPELASLQLSTLLDSVGLSLGTLASNVTDVSLDVGAVAGHASLDGCQEIWAGDLATHLTREYLTSSIITNISSPTVGGLVNAITGEAGLVSQLTTLVNGLDQDPLLRDLIIGGVTGLLGGLLGTLQLGSTEAQLEISIAPEALSTITALTEQTIADGSGILHINLGAGTVSVDTAALLGAAYPNTYGSGLNELPPNTDLLANEPIPGTLATTLGGAVTDAVVLLFAQVEAAVWAAVENINIKLDIEQTLRLALVPVANVTVSLDTSLAALREGNGVVISANVLGELISLDLLTAILSDTTATAIALLVDGVLRDALTPLVNGLIAGLDTALFDESTGVVRTLTGAVSGVYSGLFLSGIVQLLVNAQNDPVSDPLTEPADPTQGDLVPGPEPADWQNLEEGRYNVAALRVGVLNVANEAGVWLYLGKGSVGRTCSPNTAALNCAGY